MRSSAICSLVLVLLLAWGAMAQEEPQLIRIDGQQVVPAMFHEWVALQKEIVASSKAAGLPGRAVWETVIGPTNQFTTVSWIDSMGDFDPDPKRTRGMSQEEWQRWVARTRKCTVSRELSVISVFPDTVIPHKIEGSRVQLITFIENQPNKGRELHELLRDEVLPAYRKAGETGVTLQRTVAGSQGRVFGFRRVGKSFEDLGSAWIWAPVIEALGEEKGWELIGRVSPLIKSHETHGMVLREDLSFSQEK